MNRKTYLNWLNERSGTNKTQQIDEFIGALIAGAARVVGPAAARYVGKQTSQAVGSRLGSTIGNVVGDMTSQATTNVISNLSNRQQNQNTVQEDPPVVDDEDGTVPKVVEPENNDFDYRTDIPTGSNTRPLDAISVATKSNMSDIVAKPTQSLKMIQTPSPFYSYQGSYGMFQPVALRENKLNKMVNTHVEKFLKSKHGKKLKGEVNQIVSEKNLNP